MADERLLDFHKKTNREKADPKYGIEVARSISRTVNTGYDGYYEKRNRRITESRRLVAGEQDMKRFMDLMNIDGKNSFVNLDFKAPKIAQKFLDIIVQRFMERSEQPVVSAVDPQSRRKRQREKDEAQFRMEEGANIAGLEQAAGIPLEDKSKFTPEDMDDLEFYYGYEYQLPEEIRFEKALSFILADCDWNPVLKRRLIEDLCIAGFAFTKTEVDVNGKIRAYARDPESAIYSWSTYDDMRDRSWCGEIYKMKVTEYRAKFAADYERDYPGKGEQMLFEDVMKAAIGCDGYDYNLNWDWHWTSSLYRPYDDWVVEVMEFEFKTVDNNIFVSKKNRFGNIIAVDRKDKYPKEVPENKEVKVRQVYNIYRGSYIRKLDKLFCWGLAENMVRPQSNLSDVYFSYRIIMPHNRRMVNHTLPERIATSVDMMILNHLKIQHLVAKMRPSGYAIDVNGLNDLDLGLGHTVTPLELLKVADNTGNVFYRSVKEDGETRTTIPIQEMPNAGSVQQIQTCITVYNFYLERIRQDIGTNEYTEGQSVSPKTPVGVMENQVTASNRATEFIYEAYLDLMKGTCQNLGILLWDNIVFGGKEYRDQIGEMRLEDTQFDVTIEMLPDELKQAKIDAQVERALTAGLIDFQDAFKINNIKNIKLKELYLSRAQKRKQKEQIDNQQAAIQATAQSQQQSAIATSEMKQQEMNLEAETKTAIEKTKNEGQMKLSQQNFIQELVLKGLESGVPLPKNLQDMVDAYFDSRADEEEQASVANEAAMEQMMGQQQQGQQVA